MAQFDEFKAKFDSLATKVSEERAQVQQMLQALKDQVAALSGGATPAQLDDLMVSLDAMIAGVQNISEPITP